MMLATQTTGSATGAAAVVLFLIIGLLSFAAYFTPGIVASARHVPNAGSVWIINVLLGWTLIGWAVALAMACRSKYQAVMTPYGHHIPPPPSNYKQLPPSPYDPPAGGE